MKKIILYILLAILIPTLVTGFNTLSRTVPIDIIDTDGANWGGSLININGTLFINGTNQRVGIGTTTPLQTLVVVGTVNITDSLNVTNNIEAGGFFIGDGSLLTGISDTVSDTADFISNLTAVNDSISLWNVSGSDIFQKDITGNVGIGTSTPDQALHVIGNITINDSTSDGAILIDSENNAILFTGENGSLFQPVYGTDDDLVLYLPFSRGNTSSSTTVHDRSPYGNDGTCNGVSSTFGCNWTTGKYGNALFFDGDNDFINISNVIGLPEGSGSRTFEAWISSKDVCPSGHSQVIIDSGTNTASNRFALLCISGSLYFAGNANDINGVLPIPKDQWVHTAMTYDGTNLNMYLNGVLDPGSTTKTLNTISTRVTIGGSTESVTYFNGSIDEVRIYARALTADEIRTHYLRGSGFGASGAITADKFRIVNTSGNVNFQVRPDGHINVSGTSSNSTFQGDVKIIGTLYGGSPLKVGGGLNVTSGNLIFSDGSVQTSAGESSGSGNSTAWNRTGTNVILSSLTDNVGIGTTTPAEKLVVIGSVNISDSLNVSNTVQLTTLSFDDGTTQTTAAAASGWTDDGTTVRLTTASDNVGIGTTTPVETLSVTGNFSVTGNGSFGGGLTIAGDFLGVDGIGAGSIGWIDDGTVVRLADATDKVGIGTANPTMELHVIGNANISNSLFLGGNLTFGNTSDYAEMFESDVELESADVVCFDEFKKIDKCTKRADPLVIGVISTNPSIIGRTGFEKSYPVGFVGVVPTKVIGPVDRASMLTTSNKAGYAERATIADFGAIIGKALEECYKDECVIDVAVNLQ